MEQRPSASHHVLTDMLDGADDEQRERRRCGDMYEQAHDIEEREALHDVEDAGEENSGRGSIAQVAAPLHGARRWRDAVFAAVSRHEGIAQQGGDEPEERHRCGTNAEGVAENIDDEPHGEAPTYVNPSFRMAVEHEEQIDKGHGSGISHDMYMIEHHHLEQNERDGPKSVLQ